MLDTFEFSWLRAWENLKCIPPSGLYTRLLDFYSEPNRYYHTQQHLHECLLHFGEVYGLAQHPGEVEIALWFHDAIYDSKSIDNELRSANLAVDLLIETNVSEDVIVRVYHLILATKHSTISIEPDHRLLVDIDLAILGANTERFNEYNQQIEQEYSWAPREVYLEKRSDVLKSFLHRPSIYTTGYFKDRFELQAQSNIRKVVE